MIINHNIMALNTHRQLAFNNTNTQKSMEKLSSGLRINRAGDDAAGLAISEKMRAQIRGLNMATKNAQDGISLIQTAEGALNESHAILQRMRELAVQAANDTNTDADRAELQKEVDQLAQELTRIAETTEFNTQKLLDGTFTGTFHIGANEGQNISLSISNMDAKALNVGKILTAATEEGTTLTGANILQDEEGNTVAVFMNDGYYAVSDLAEQVDEDSEVTSVVVREGASPRVALESALDDGEEVAVGIDISSQQTADTAITIINNAIEKVSAQRANLGAVQNRLEHTINNLGTSSENLTAAESRIRDVDMAKEMMEFTKNNILAQAANAMLAQANQQPQQVLQLLR
ncbi:flagellin [Novibacillus thermophilus]|uniref:Flagellin n=1 Tax=Novibacillus thermophilus TaxID=1471761 RepID=A0A1U9K4Q8_9BACL|nr:flagellin [Novibacillus thermophilus]AQS55000.1 flagellin [Novibacillus thermophilus]